MALLADISIADSERTIHPPVIRLASDIGLFDHLKAAAGSPKHNNDLASATSADARLTGKWSATSSGTCSDSVLHR